MVLDGWEYRKGFHEDRIAVVPYVVGNRKAPCSEEGGRRATEGKGDLANVFVVVFARVGERNPSWCALTGFSQSLRSVRGVVT
jgi:hypothetical protein